MEKLTFAGLDSKYIVKMTSEEAWIIWLSSVIRLLCENHGACPVVSILTK